MIRCLLDLAEDHRRRATQFHRVATSWWAITVFGIFVVVTGYYSGLYR